MRLPGPALALVALTALLALAGWHFARSHVASLDPGLAPAAPGVPGEPPGEESSAEPGVELAQVSASAAAVDRMDDGLAPTPATFEGPAGPFQIAVRVLDAGTREPVEHYRVLIALAGTKDLDALPAAQRLVTSAAGECRWPDLESIGPWDVHVGAIGFEGERFGSGDVDRVATVMGLPAPGARPEPVDLTPENTLEVLVETGPRVTYRGPLPAGVQPGDLRFDLRGRISPYSSNSGDAGGPARGRVGAEGWVTAAIPPIQNSLTGPNFGVRIWTADGNFGLLSVHPGKPSNTTHVVVEEPLRSRAKVRFRVELMRNRDGALVATSREIAEALGWETRGTDPERDALDPPAALMAGPWSRDVEEVGPDTFEIGDLPPTTLTFRGWRDGARLAGRVQAPEGVQATAAHGEPTPVVLQLRPVE